MPRMKMITLHYAVIAIEIAVVVVGMAPVVGHLHSSFDFDVVKGDGDEGKVGHGGGTLVVTNSGLFQVTGMLLTWTIPGAHPIDMAGACMEGRVSVDDNGHIRAEFDRMTPGMECRLANVVDRGMDPSGIAITADGYTGVWTIEQSIHQSVIRELFMSWLTIPLVIAVVHIFFVFTTIIHAAFGLYWGRVEQRKPDPNATENIQEFIKKEYGVKLTCNEGAVLTLIVCGKDTIGQLEVHTGMRRWHIRHLINQLRRRCLVESDRIAPVPSLAFLADYDDVCAEHRSQRRVQN